MALIISCKGSDEKYNLCKISRTGTAFKDIGKHRIVNDKKAGLLFTAIKNVVTNTHKYPPYYLARIKLLAESKEITISP